MEPELKYLSELKMVHGKIGNLNVTQLGSEIGDKLKRRGIVPRNEARPRVEDKPDLLELLFDYLSDDDVQIILDKMDPVAWREARKRIVEIRKQRAETIASLKRIYKGCCQLCGVAHGKRFGIELTEVHHIVPFAVEPNNDVSNLMVLCPNCHALIHRAEGTFDRNRLQIIFRNGTQIKLKNPKHLNNGTGTR